MVGLIASPPGMLTRPAWSELFFTNNIAYSFLRFGQMRHVEKIKKHSKLKTYLKQHQEELAL